MTPISDAAGAAPTPPDRLAIVSALGITQIFAWGASYYLPAVLAAPIAADTGWSLTWVVGGLSLGLLAAGAISPRVGRAIAKHGGRPVLAVSTGLFAAGLVGLSLANSLTAFLLAWVVIGFGMGAGLYDPAFATLGRLYGQSGRSAITSLTLFGGFASTVCWPLSAFLEARFGWRGTCLIYAALQLGMALPVYLFVLPREQKAIAHAPDQAPTSASKHEPATAPNLGLFLLLAATITLASVVSTVMSVHLLTVLKARGLTLAAAVSLGALVGPAQVAARAIEMAIARFHHPIWTKVAATSLVTIGLATLWAGGPMLTVALVLYGAGIGLESIARGTLPLAMFGAHRYPIIMGRIAMPSLIAQAAAPSIGAVLLESAGIDAALAAFIGAAAVNVVLVIGLYIGMNVRRPASR
ncbi:MAG: MFS transporter [Ancalomicrobiaceae bacterium]|nr:MFS transporter [Ancalomicrobiaceae bacterium]